MKRADYAIVAAARAYCKSVEPPITKAELAEQTFRKFPTLWELLTPGEQAKWCWEQRKHDKEAGQLPLDGLDGQTILSRDDWGDDMWKRQAQRYWAAAQSNLRLLANLKAEYEATRHQQLTLDFEMEDA